MTTKLLFCALLTSTTLADTPAKFGAWQRLFGGEPGSLAAFAANDKRIAAQLVGHTPIGFDNFRKTIENSAYTFMRKRLVLLNKRGGANYIGVENYGEFAC